MSSRSVFRTPLAVLGCAIVFVLCVTAVPPAGAQQQDTERKTPLQLLDDFAHYTLVARPDLAAAYARALLDSGISEAELIVLLDEGPISPERVEAALTQAITMDGLEEVAAELGRFLEQGRLDLARNPKRIAEAVQMLVGTRRQQIIAHRRLREAGEYAVPELLRQITDGRDMQLRNASRNMLRDLGLHAVMPLAEAVRHIGDPAAQRHICEVLTQIGYPHAGPFLLELRDDPSTARNVREAADQALRRLDVRNVDLSMLYTSLARDYYNDAQFLISQPHETTNNLWAFDQTIGLTPTPIPTEIYGRVMAMRFTSKALKRNPGNLEALGLFVAANLKRENDLPAGAVDPIYGESSYSPAFYATVFGTGVCMDVLELAMVTGDTPLVRDALAALAGTTGGSNLFSFGGGRQPLLHALRYPDRRVQIEAALTLGRALPQQSFAGDYSVVSILASSVRAGDQLFALIAADDPEDRRELAAAIEPLGFTVVGAESEFAALRNAIDFAVGVDLVVVRMRNVDRTYETVEHLRRLPKTSVAPFLVLVDQVEVPSVRLEYRGDPRIAITRPAISDEAFENVVVTLLERSSGVRIGEAEAEAYAIEALQALRDIAISSASVYDVRDAEIALLDALGLRTGGTRMMVANILALIDSEHAQQSLFDAATSADEWEQIDLLDATAESVRRFGNHLRDYQIAALLDLVARSEGGTAEAAARLHGALNLPTSAAIDLIP